MSTRGHAVVVMAPLLILAGCATLPKPGVGGAEKSEPRGPMHEKAEAIAASGGLAAVGVGRDSSIGDAVDKAKAQAQAVMARVVASALEALAKDFAAETGEKKSSDLDSFFGSVLKHLKGETLPRLALAGMDYATRDRVTTANAMMEASPRILIAAMEEARANGSVRARFMASKTFRALEERAARYGEFRRQKGRQ